MVDGIKALDKEVAIDGVRYQLGMVNLWDKHKNHFVSLHWVQNEFLFYDGMNKSKRKIRRAYPTDYKQETIYTDHILYVRIFNNKGI